METMTAPGEHLTDGELVCHLDGELAPGERDRAQAHAERCEECARRLAALRTQSQALSELLARSPAPEYGELRRARARAALREAEERAAARRRAPSRWPLRAAASITLLLAAAFTVEPVRAWMSERWEDLAPQVRPERADEALPAGSESQTSPAIAFETVGEEFVLEVARAQRRGTLTLRVADEERATARATGPDAAGILVRPNGIRIENEAASGGSYELLLPRQTRHLRLRVDGQPEVVIPLDAAGAPIVIDLADPPAR